MCERKEMVREGEEERYRRYLVLFTGASNQNAYYKVVINAMHLLEK